MNGKLYIVATPIGNLEDITFRAIRILKEVDFICAEDTRTTGNLLKHYDISNQLISFNARMESGKLNNVIEKISHGSNCALVSDAGTPCISDPGVRLVSEAIKNNIEVVSVPGASAVISALSIAGLPTDSFVFEGFLPQKKGRQKKLKELSAEPRTVVLYESMYRIEKLINELEEYMPNRFVVICRELTKKFEEKISGFPNDLKEKIKKSTLKGEFVVVISPNEWRIEE